MIAANREPYTFDLHAEHSLAAIGKSTLQFELRIPWASAELNAVMPELMAEARAEQTAHAVVCGLSVHVADIGHAMHVRIESEEWETGYFLRGDSFPVFVQAPFDEFQGQSGRVRIDRSGLLFFRYGLKSSDIGGN